MFRLLSLAILLLANLLTAACFANPALDADLRALDSMRKGLATPLDQVDLRGEELLKQYEAPAEQAQIYYQLTHVHVQSGMKQPATILKYAQTALDSKLLAPEQRGMLYSYMASAYEVDSTTKEFAKRRRNAMQPLLQGWQELQAFNLPERAPEFPAIGKFGGDRAADPAEQARQRRAAEEAQRAREEVERIRTLVQRRDTLKLQIRGLYGRQPADEELSELVTKQLGKEVAQPIVDEVRAERERTKKK